MSNETQPHSPWEFELAYDENNRLVIRRPVPNEHSHMAPLGGVLSAEVNPPYVHSTEKYGGSFVGSYTWGLWELIRDTCEHEFIAVSEGNIHDGFARTITKCQKCGKKP